MNFTLTILGSASALPFSDRNPSAQALSVHGRLFLIDCGEGTQQRIRQEHLSFVKIEAVFISHIHGDHVFGLFGLLSTMSLYHRTGDLHVFGPQNLGPVLNFYRSYFGQELGFEIVFHPLTFKTPTVIAGTGCPSSTVSLRSTPPFASLMVPPLSVPRVAAASEGQPVPAETVNLGKNVRVTAFPLNHKIDCYGFRFDEVVGPRRNPWKPRSYAYCSDTAPFPELAQYIKGVDILYHETTYPADMQDKAEQYFHSTTLQAACCAKEAGVGKLLTGHYSSRVKDIAALADECRTIFPESYTVNDGDVFEIPYIREHEKVSSDSVCDADGADAPVGHPAE
jgi:ribonuclease Z